jgi:hypothetical protein
MAVIEIRKRSHNAPPVEWLTAQIRSNGVVLNRTNDVRTDQMAGYDDPTGLSCPFRVTTMAPFLLTDTFFVILSVTASTWRWQFGHPTGHVSQVELETGKLAVNDVFAIDPALKPDVKSVKVRPERTPVIRLVDNRPTTG